MTHARLTIARMLDWIEQRIAADRPTPTDAEICDRFGFESSESARTLLAHLADAGKITIHGYGDDRTVTLGRTKRRPAAIGRITPPIVRADPVLDRGVAKIAAILARGRAPATMPVPIDPGSVDPAPSLPAPTAEPVHLREETTVPNPPPSNDFRNVGIMARGPLLHAIQRRSESLDVSLGKAAASLIEDAIALSGRPAGAPIDLAALPSADLIEEIGHRLTSGSPDLAAAAVTRAEAAEGQLETLRKQLAQLLGGAA